VDDRVGSGAGDSCDRTTSQMMGLLPQNQSEGFSMKQECTNTTHKHKIPYLGESKVITS
jgi:hypothetical protein